VILKMESNLPRRWFSCRTVILLSGHAVAEEYRSFPSDKCLRKDCNTCPACRTALLQFMRLSSFQFFISDKNVRQVSGVRHLIAILFSLHFCA
jgi:hypothetical protein